MTKKEEKEEITITIGGMDCNNCALTIQKALEKEGAQNVWVDFTLGEAQFHKNKNENIEKYLKAIEKSGYKVIEAHHQTEQQLNRKLKFTLVISFLFTIPLLLSMLPWFAFIHHPLLHFILATPVWLSGLYYFWKPAWGSLVNRSPNMDVLVIIGSSAAFIYSSIGIILYGFSEHAHNYLFFETAASIILFILIGNFIEHKAVEKTTDAIRSLQNLQNQYANLIIENSGETKTTRVPSETLQPGDCIQINTGEIVPVDCIIESQSAIFNESLLTGESMPVTKSAGDEIYGGTSVTEGSVKARVIRSKSFSALAQIVQLVRKAQREKASIQQIGDKIAEIFVPAVIAIAILTFLISFYFIHLPLTDCIMRSIAVIVISCPCAMGLAAPTAVATAIGKAARNNILVKSARAFEWMSKANFFVFDKTGTLTTGHIQVDDLYISPAYESEKEKIIGLICAAERHSSHPIARSVLAHFESMTTKIPEIQEVKEIKGRGISFMDMENNHYILGSYIIASIENPLLAEQYDIFLKKNDTLLAALRLHDEPNPDIIYLIEYLRQNGKQVYLLSGDKKNKCLSVAHSLGIPIAHVMYEKLPDEKLKVIETLKKQGTVCMIGDGINDAPSLTAAHLSISFSHASQAAMDAATVIISSKDISNAFIFFHQLSDLTVKKIKQNFFWAFFYNIVAIPLAAAGLLRPIFAALSMAFSDVIVVGNSLLINFSKKTSK